MVGGYKNQHNCSESNSTERGMTSITIIRIKLYIHTMTHCLYLQYMSPYSHTGYCRLLTDLDLK
jgi:hypothetical protein